MQRLLALARPARLAPLAPLARLAHLAHLGLLAVAACGGSSAATTPPNSVTGSVRGQPFASVYAAAGAYAQPSGTGASSAQLLLTLSTEPGYRCEQLAAAQPKSGRFIAFTLVTVAHKSVGFPAGAGDYLVTDSPGTDGNFALVTYGEADAQCRLIKAQAAIGATGTVHLSRLGSTAAAEAAGTFDVIFDSGDRVVGAFDTTLCAGTAGSDPTCQ